jgi:hypothetical protein
MILARQAMVKQWQHVWRTGDTGRFAHSIWPLVSVKPWFDGQAEERSFVITTSRVMSGHCSIRAHLERFRIVGDPICVCIMNYETVDHICHRFLRECGLKIWENLNGLMLEVHKKLEPSYLWKKLHDIICYFSKVNNEIQTKTYYKYSEKVSSG